MTHESVIAPYGEPGARLPWEFVPNMQEECLEFKKLDKMYPVNCEQAQ